MVGLSRDKDGSLRRKRVEVSEISNGDWTQDSDVGERNRPWWLSSVCGVVAGSSLPAASGFWLKSRKKTVFYAETCVGRRNS